MGFILALSNNTATFSSHLTFSILSNATIRKAYIADSTEEVQSNLGHLFKLGKI